METHKDLDVWKLSIELVVNIYKFTEEFPKSELYGLTSQIRRAAVSIPSNIAEGAARKNTKEFIQFLYISLGSIAEIDTQLIISQRLGYAEINGELADRIEHIRKMLINLIRKLKEKMG
ncbi:four helix bundle protein [Acetobacteroides hydrogenigenes]|uniref:Four helix bundle protein n=1 Tax=Acetobacteroides hydrogenigenes TaxID=979970 RepID=A0A4R2E8U0_9BACT|nr:four helix bundle protein [Acetobacteroides hydrogenigenes]TCN62194.1 four helix bundle protein [Acetobacteroides hydrogenigenes]